MPDSQSSTRRLVWFVLFAAVALVVTVVWTWAAQTQAAADLYSNIVANAEGKLPTPFVTRRLAADGGRLLARVVPDSAWDAISSQVFAIKPLAKLLNNPLNWTPADFPLLASTTFLIWLSVAGFMGVMRSLIRHWYLCPDTLAALLSLLIGFGLLTACGDRHYGSYPYDYPNVFVFSLTLLAMVKKVWWMPVAFAFAAYSKETSLLLVFIFVLLFGRTRSARFWLTLSVMLITYAAIRLFIQTVFVTPTTEHMGFWSFRRNLVLIAHWLVYDFWLVLIAGLLIFRIHRVVRDSLPQAIRSAAPVFLLLFGAALFKGWFEERRQYLEAYPFACLVVFQWAFSELGLTSLFSPRVEPEPPTDPTPHPTA